MGKVCRVKINKETVSANPGDLLLDVALMNGIELPHDCRSGYCGTCQVRVVKGRCLGPASDKPGFVHACQTRVVSDLQVTVEKVPEIREQDGTVVGLRDVAPDVVEVCVRTPRRFVFLPGQYLSVQFRGFPARHYSPTAPLTWPANPDLVRFHIRRVPDGRVSSALGRRIRKGHRVRLTGPFGSAYFRPKHTGRIVLVAGGTGFAPIWSIAEAAVKERPGRELVLIAGAAKVDSLYMIPALCRLALFPRATIIPTAAEPQKVSPAVRLGHPTDHVPPLRRSDIVYTCGAPPMVEAAARLANAVGAPCYSDPFVPSNGSEGGSFLSRTAKWIASPVSATPQLAMVVGRP
jgi:NAD(P)H-flavin reductase/ferredoxin